MSAHQQLHAEVETLRQAVAAGERRVQDCAKLLTEADAVLRGPLRDAKRLLEAGRKAEAGELRRESNRAAEAADLAVGEARTSNIPHNTQYCTPLGMIPVFFSKLRGYAN